MSSKNVFLGGTCGNYPWRIEFIENLVRRGVPSSALFNPVLPPDQSWTEADKEREDEAKRTARYLMFHLGNPKEPDRSPHSMYSLVQLVQSAFKVDRDTRAFFDLSLLDERTARNIKAIAGDVERRFPGTVLGSWQDFVDSIAKLWASKRDMCAFLGGTCGNNLWRKRLLLQLAARGVDTRGFFDPRVVPGAWDWNIERLEDQVRRISDSEFYYIGDPMEKRAINDQISPYSVVEALFALYTDLERAVICFDYSEWEGESLQTMTKFEADIRRDFPMAKIFSTLANAEDWIVGEFAPAQAAA